MLLPGEDYDVAAQHVYGNDIRDDDVVAVKSVVENLIVVVVEAVVQKILKNSDVNGVVVQRVDVVAVENVFDVYYAHILYCQVVERFKVVNLGVHVFSAAIKFPKLACPVWLAWLGAANAGPVRLSIIAPALSPAASRTFVLLFIFTPLGVAFTSTYPITEKR